MHQFISSPQVAYRVLQASGASSWQCSGAQGSGAQGSGAQGSKLNSRHLDIFCAGGVDFGMVSYRCSKGGIFLEGGMDFGIRRHLT